MSRPAADEPDDVGLNSKVIPTPVVAALAVLVVLLVVLAVYVWGERAFDLLLVVGLFGVWARQFAREHREEETRADVDVALSGLEDLKALRFGLDPPATGRHAKPEAEDPPRYEWSSQFSPHAITAPVPHLTPTTSSPTSSPTSSRDLP